MTANQNIVQLGADILRESAVRVDDFDNDQLQDLVSRMLELMQAGNGVGIAAPQIGESWRVIVVASRPTLRYPLAPEMPATVMINPEFEVEDATLIKDWEGCLSIPGIRALVPRFRAVRVRFQNIIGEREEMLLEDFPARIFQHEFDHLQGLVYLDRVESNRDIISESEFSKRYAA
jgi:peptide deformylase